jgi:hypothetical protein
MVRVAVGGAAKESPARLVIAVAGLAPRGLEAQRALNPRAIHAHIDA